MGANNCSDTYNVLHFPKNEYYLPACIKMIITPLVIDIFFMKFAPLDSAYINLSIHDKSSIFMKYPKCMVLFLRAGHIL